MTEKSRATAKKLARWHLANGDPTGWFEVLYAKAESDLSIVPWADLAPNPHLVSWLEQQCMAGAGHKALKIGCGLGDDAEELSHRGFETTAFDISPTAISWCHRRFPKSSVHYVVADIFKTPNEWVNRFDFVLECYTLQVLPPNLREQAIRHMANFVAPNGILLVIARGREPGEPEGEMPWPLTRQEMAAFMDVGLAELNFEDYMDNETPPVRRFRAIYQKK
jgi:SAM-dependent methyltransferase